MKRHIFGRPAAPREPRPCFCGCGGIASFGGPGAPSYLPGHAPHERAPAPTAPPWVGQAGAQSAALPPMTGTQGDLFGPPRLPRQSR